MNRSVIAGGAIVAVLASAVAGYRFGAGTWPILPHRAEVSGSAQVPAAAKTVLYWKDPDGKNEFSPEPKKTADGRDYLPVHEGQEAGFEDSKPAKPRGQGRILYYRNPMGLPDASPVPKKDPMGMDYIPVFEDGEDDRSTVKIPLGKLQRTGVRSEPVTPRIVSTPVRAPGVVQAGEHRQSLVALRFDAFIDGYENITTGSTIRKGEPLMRVYGPALSAAAAAYLTDLNIRDPGGLPANRGARQRLENLGVPEEIVKQIERSRQGSLAVAWPSPRDGLIIEHNIVEGMEAKTGQVLFRIADLSVVWVLADVSERDLALVAPGQTATAVARGHPGHPFTGNIGVIYPELNKETRTARVRIELANPGTVLLPNMYADVTIATGGGSPVLAVPENAVIGSGTRHVVILDKGEGRFEPREVKTGRRGGGFIEIGDGVSEGDRVVTAANFLIDSESNLKAALRGLAMSGEKQ